METNLTITDIAFFALLTWFCIDIVGATYLLITRPSLRSRVTGPFRRAFARFIDLFKREVVEEVEEFEDEDEEYDVADKIESIESELGFLRDRVYALENASDEDESDEDENCDCDNCGKCDNNDPCDNCGDSDDCGCSCDDEEDDEDDCDEDDEEPNPCAVCEKPDCYGCSENVDKPESPVGFKVGDSILLKSKKALKAIYGDDDDLKDFINDCSGNVFKIDFVGTDSSTDESSNQFGLKDSGGFYCAIQDIERKIGDTVVTPNPVVEFKYANGTLIKVKSREELTAMYDERFNDIIDEVADQIFTINTTSMAGNERYYKVDESDFAIQDKDIAVAFVPVTK